MCFVVIYITNLRPFGSIKGRLVHKKGCSVQILSRTRSEDHGPSDKNSIYAFQLNIMTDKSLLETLHVELLNSLNITA